MQNNPQKDWEEYKSRELDILKPLLNELGFELEEHQPHLLGERYLMQAVTTIGGKKLILIGRRKKDNKRAVIKATKDNYGKWELEHERMCRNVLHHIRFAYKTFLSPEEILFTSREGYTISIQTFIEQECPFTARILRDQFFLALKAFKAQESAHATTYSHEQLIAKTFGRRSTQDYLNDFSVFRELIVTKTNAKELGVTLEQAEEFLKRNSEVIEQYGGFLTHTDFVPHNFRVKNGEIYLLDHSSLRFGNKYEGWARFINFMTLYNPELAQALIDYVHLNRTPEESLALKLMRIYRLGEIMAYYTAAVSNSVGDLQELNRARIYFWADVLRAVLSDTSIDPVVVATYRATRDRLRSPEEKVRQKDLH